MFFRDYWKELDSGKRPDVSFYSYFRKVKNEPKTFRLPKCRDAPWCIRLSISQVFADGGCIRMHPYNLTANHLYKSNDQPFRQIYTK